MSLEHSDILELKDRYTFLMEKYATLALEVAPQLDKLGKYRKELQIITAEFVRRGADIEDSEFLENLIKEELQKRGLEEE